MMMRAALGLVTFALAAAAVTGDAQQRPTFRAVGALVTVEVEVRDGNRLVRGLTAADFQVADNGVPQRVETLDVESLPIDLTLVVDTSGSVGKMIEQLRLYTREASMLLRADDRFRLITFAGDVRDIYGLQPATELPPVEKIQADGATSIFDALTAALMKTRLADRRQIVMAYTDGGETHSALEASALVSVAKRSDSVLHVFLIRNPMYDPRLAPTFRADSRSYWLSGFSSFEASERALSEAAAATGGVMQKLLVRDRLPTFLRRTLEEFRTSYVLRYVPTGVKPEGWHTIEVRTASGHRVRARPGYFWGSLGK